MAQVDRTGGLTGMKGVKDPVKAVAITAITLAGEQSVGGVAVVTGDRVLVTAQASSVDNGVYDVATSAWTRSKDFNGAKDVAVGTLVVVADGRQYRVATAGAIGTGAVTFAAAGGFNITGTGVSFLDFGGVADGADTGTAFTGTDNTAAFQLALDYCGANDLVLAIPSGKYRFAANTVNNTGTLTLNYSKHIIVGEGAELLIDDDSPTTYSLLDFIRTAGYGTSTTLNDRELLSISGVAFRGRWNHSNTYAGPNALTVENFARLELHGVSAYDLRAKFSRTRYCGEVTVTNFHGERIASDGLRFIDCPKVTIDGATLNDIDDNCIALPSTAANADVRQGINISNVMATKCVGMLVLGAKNISITNYTTRLGSANGIYIGGPSAPEGDTTPFNIVLDSINIVDPLGRPSGGSNGVPPTAITTGTDAAIVIAGIESTAITTGALPGYYDSVAGAFVIPYALDNNSHPIFYNATKASNTVAEGRNFSLSNFSVTRTLPSIAAYASWGFGNAFSRYGYYNPPVTDASFVTHGVQLVSQQSDVAISNGTVFGFPNGAAVWFQSSASSTARRNFEFNGINISNVVGTHVKYGVSHSATTAAATFTWDVTISDCVFNCDPYHVSTARTSPINGSWIAGIALGDKPVGVYFRQSFGWKISDCVFSNCYDPILANTDFRTQSDVSNNICKCQPVAVGYNVGNLGVGVVPSGGPAFRHVIVDGTPSSATYGEVLNHCVVSATTVPTTGTYVTGHFVANQAPTTASSKTTLGWVRQTVGSGHAVATTTTADWAPLVIPTA